MTTRRKPIAEGGTRSHLDTCACGAQVIRHRAVGGSVVLEAKPVAKGRFVLFMGIAIPDPDVRNLRENEPLYNAHTCKETA